MRRHAVSRSPENGSRIDCARRPGTVVGACRRRAIPSRSLRHRRRIRLRVRHGQRPSAASTPSNCASNRPRKRRAAPFTAPSPSGTIEPPSGARTGAQPRRVAQGGGRSTSGWAGWMSSANAISSDSNLRALVNMSRSLNERCRFPPLAERRRSRCAPSLTIWANSSGVPLTSFSSVSLRRDSQFLELRASSLRRASSTRLSSA